MGTEGSMWSWSQRRGGAGGPRERAGWSAFVNGDVGLHVVLVAAAGVDGAAGEDAGPVAQGDELAHPLGRVVLVHGLCPRHVEDRLDRHGRRSLEPVADEVEGRRAE